MRECKFILPKAAGDHFKLRKQLCFAFGGFTTYEAAGGWMPEPDSPRIEMEEHHIYVVAVHDGDAESQLRQFAVDWGRIMAQVELYFVNRNGEVEFINLQSGEITE